MLTRTTFRTAVFLGAVTVALVVSWLLGRPAGNIALGTALTVFFAGYSVVSRRRGRVNEHLPRW